MRFYGLNLSEVRELSIDDAEALWQTVTVLEAREMLNAITVGDMPHLKKEPRQKQFRAIHKMAHPKTHEDSSAPVTTEDLARLLAGGS